MAITVPDDPRLATATERRVWAALSEQLGDGDLVIASQRVTFDIGQGAKGPQALAVRPE